MPRFFVPRDQLPNILGQDARQIDQVLRLKPGDKLELLDGSGKVYPAKIAEIKKDQVRCEILSEKQIENNPGPQITIAQCLPKAKKMDLIIQKCTELGVSKIIPTLSERSIAKADKLDRWQRIAKEAAEQSNRTTIPTIAPLTKLEDVLKLQADLKLIPWELETKTSLKKILKAHEPKNLICLIGPEGGFSSAEVELAQKSGWQSVSLGHNILRTETAGLAILSMINYEFE